MTTKTPLAVAARKQLDKMIQLTFQTDGTLPVIDKQQDREEWMAWRRWRVNNDLNVAFMDTRKTWTVPTRIPPIDWDQAIRDMKPQKSKTKARQDPLL